MSFTDLDFELNRLNTFENKWPHTYISKEILAKIGFFFVGPYDEVKCTFCNVIIKNWKMGDNEVAEHIRWSPNCPLLKRSHTTNIPTLPSNDLNQLLPPIGHDTCGIYTECPKSDSIANMKAQ